MNADRRTTGPWEHWLLALGLATMGGLGGGLAWTRLEPAWLALGVWIPAGLACGALVLVPASRRPLLLFTARLTTPIGLAISLLVLALIYWLLLTPLGLARRLFGRDPLQRKPDSRARSYWQDHRADTHPDADFRQY